MQAIKQANNQENKQSNNQERSRTMNDNHNEDEAPFDGTSEDSTLEDQMSAHIAAIAASGVAAEAEALANRQADMAARERRETRLAILAAIAIIGAFAICVIKTLKKYTATWRPGNAVKRDWQSSPPSLSLALSLSASLKR